MSSWVQKTLNGRWMARYRAADGKTRSKTWDRKTDAERWLRAELGRRDRGEWVDPKLGKTRFGEWAETVMGARLHTRASTQARDRSYLDSLVLPTFGGFELRRITPADIQGVGIEARRCRVRSDDGPQGACPAADDPHRGGGVRLACTVTGSRRQAAADRKTRDAVPYPRRTQRAARSRPGPQPAAWSRPRRTPACGSASSPACAPATSNRSGRPSPCAVAWSKSQGSCT